jgi:hypothetical protein
LIIPHDEFIKEKTISTPIFQSVVKFIDVVVIIEIQQTMPVPNMADIAIKQPMSPTSTRIFLIGAMGSLTFLMLMAIEEKGVGYGDAIFNFGKKIEYSSWLSQALKYDEHFFRYEKRFNARLEKYGFLLRK